MYICYGNVPYPLKYKNARIKCAELITEVQIKSDEEITSDGRKRLVYLNTIILQFSDNVFACFMMDEEE